MERVYMNRIPGEECIHVEFTADDIDAVLRDLPQIGISPATQRLYHLLHASRAGLVVSAPTDDDGELVCVDQCGSCDACGMEPFGTPAEGWREAVRFLRRIPRDSRDYPAVLTGARVIEEHLRRQAEARAASEEAS